MSNPVGTTDGNWTMADSPAYFAAVVSAHFPAVSEVNQYLLVTAPDIEGTGKVDTCETYCRNGGRLMVDSGIFGIAMAAAERRGVSHNEGLNTPPDQIEGWQEFVASWSRCIDRLRHLCWGYVEIDLGGTEQKRRTRAMLEEQGYRPIPVVHPLTDGWDYFEELASTYDRLCIGNLVKSDHATRIELLRGVAERRRGRRVQWIHALGVTPSPQWLGVRTESCDSTAHGSHLRWAQPMLDTSCFGQHSIERMPYRRATGAEDVDRMRRHLYFEAEQLRRSVQSHGHESVRHLQV